MASYIQATSLTRFPRGSVRELWNVSFPLILTSLSTYLMLTADRIILGQYSTTVMNAAVAASNIGAMFFFGLISVCTIAEVFVGQFNGAGHTHKLGEPVWQMLWLCISSAVIFIPLGLWGGPYMLSSQFDPEGISYFCYLMTPGFIFAFAPTLASFYIGQGKTKIVVYASIAGNTLNIILDYIFVFGIEGIIPSMGAKGAAIASIIGALANATILAIPFCASKNRLTKGTRYWRIQPKLFMDCINIGLPNAIGHVIEMLGWVIIFNMAIGVSVMHVTVLSIFQATMFMVIFFSEGLQKGVIAICSNFIGAKDKTAISRTLQSSIKLSILIALIYAAPLMLFPEAITSLFISSDFDAITSIEELMYFFKNAYIFTWLFIVFEMLAWCVAGILIAAGDTKYVMFITSTNIWISFFLPSWFFVYKLQWSPTSNIAISIFYALIAFCCFLVRYKKGSWRKIQITHS